MSLCVRAEVADNVQYLYVNDIDFFSRLKETRNKRNIKHGGGKKTKSSDAIVFLLKIIDAIYWQNTTTFFIKEFNLEASLLVTRMPYNWAHHTTNTSEWLEHWLEYIEKRVSDDLKLCRRVVHFGYPQT